MNWRRLWLALLAVLAATLWWQSQKRRPHSAAAPGTAQSPPGFKTAAPVDLTTHDGATIDFSSGQPVVKDSPGEKAANQQAGQELDEAAKDVTFRPTEPAKTENSQRSVDPAEHPFSHSLCAGPVGRIIHQVGAGRRGALRITRPTKRQERLQTAILRFIAPRGLGWCICGPGCSPR